MATATIANQQSTIGNHKAWLRALPLPDRVTYDRAYGKAWYDGKDDDTCRLVARAAVAKAARKAKGADDE